MASPAPPDRFQENAHAPATDLAPLHWLPLAALAFLALALAVPAVTAVPADAADAANAPEAGAAQATPAAEQAPRITLDATSWCGYCRKTRALLKELDVAYVEKDIEKSEEGREEYLAKGKGYRAARHRGHHRARVQRRGDPQAGGGPERGAGGPGQGGGVAPGPFTELLHRTDGPSPASVYTAPRMQRQKPSPATGVQGDRDRCARCERGPQRRRRG